MRRLCGSLLSGIDLYHARDVKRVDSCEWVRSDEDDAAIGVDFLLRISQPNGLQDCSHGERAGLVYVG